MMIRSNECRMKLMMIWDMIHLMLHLLNGWGQNFLTTRRWIIIQRKHYRFIGLEEMMKLSSRMKNFLKDEVVEVFRIDTNIFDFETPIWKEDGYCNRGNFPGAYHIGNSLHYQDLEWYEALEDSELKNKALRNQDIMEGLISDDESYNDYGKRWKSHEINYHYYNEGEYENKTHEEGHKICGIETCKVPVCQIKRYKMIKYSFNDEEEYVAIKEDEYDDLTITSDEACRAYQEIFRMMDEGWMVTRNE
ncbi:hypothetical protein Tco_1510794 [Tanacetum coccineum]